MTATNGRTGTAPEVIELDDDDDEASSEITGFSDDLPRGTIQTNRKATPRGREKIPRGVVQQTRLKFEDSQKTSKKDSMKDSMKASPAASPEFREIDFNEVAKPRPKLIANMKPNLRAEGQTSKAGETSAAGATHKPRLETAPKPRSKNQATRKVRTVRMFTALSLTQSVARFGHRPGRRPRSPDVGFDCQRCDVALWLWV